MKRVGSNLTRSLTLPTLRRHGDRRVAFGRHYGWHHRKPVSCSLGEDIGK